MSTMGIAWAKILKPDSDTATLDRGFNIDHVSNAGQGITDIYLSVGVPIGVQRLCAVMTPELAAIVSASGAGNYIRCVTYQANAPSNFVDRDFHVLIFGG